MKTKTPIAAVLMIAWLLTLTNASAFYDPGAQRWINRDPIGEHGGLNLYQFAESSPTLYSDKWGLRPIVFPDGPPGWDICVLTALAKLMETGVGEQMGKDMVDKDIFIIPAHEAKGGTASRHAPTGVVALNVRDPMGVPSDLRFYTPSLLPETDDPVKGFAVVLGHELSHAIYNVDDLELIYDYENHIRKDLGLPRRKLFLPPEEKAWMEKARAAERGDLFSCGQ
ncbi:MAG TPA: RHS repeat-associated core domain-containing protein [Verrucomicrobiae bacterium]|nr:RHS repeat-associated core domain-containing protein [Verrucomicrobiae bacterium]